MDIKLEGGTIKAIEFAGVGSIPQLLIVDNGMYKHIPVKTGITLLIEEEE